jgi:hypothetical protein
VSTPDATPPPPPSRPVALLVTGSRSLATRIARAEWAHAIVADAVRALPPGSLLLHGGATGPDQWAHDVALHHRPDVAIHVYQPNGHLRRYSERSGDLRFVEPGRWSATDAGPLARNRHLVHVLAALPGYTPRVLAVVDPASRTHGADHTARLARAAGLPVDRRVHPGATP